MKRLINLVKIVFLYCLFTSILFSRVFYSYSPVLRIRYEDNVNRNNFRKDLVREEDKENATVYIWDPSPGHPFGYAAIMSDDGNYLSFYPKKGTKDDKSDFLNTSIIFGTASKWSKSYKKDQKHFGKYADFVYYEKGDEETMSKVIKEIKQNEPNYHFLFNNCTTQVENVLSAGGISTPRSIIKTPWELKSFLREKQLSFSGSSFSR